MTNSTNSRVSFFASNLAFVRFLQKKTQAEMAEWLGFSRPTIQKLEKAGSSFKSDTALTIAEKLGLSLEDLFYRDFKGEALKLIYNKGADDRC